MEALEKRISLLEEKVNQLENELDMTNQLNNSYLEGLMRINQQILELITTKINQK